mmetsp:Transcript_4008/g.9383  ORF Transcript_4008/g.9383 Transcript_4008/m.9383 type:complete len:238 (-) Transcript_4008:52-765(-)
MRAQGAQDAERVQRIQQFATGDDFHEEVDLGWAPERPHELDDKRMIDLRKDAQLRDKCLLRTMLHNVTLPDALQRVADASAPGAYKFHDAEATTPNDSQRLQVAEGDLRVLERDSRFQVLCARIMHNFLEGLLSHHPELCVLYCSYSRRTGFAVKQSALAEVVTQAVCPNLAPVNLYQDSAFADDVQMGAQLPLLEDSITRPLVLDLQCISNPLQLLLGQRLEDDEGPVHGNALNFG